jgi:hypothetical protein
MNVRLIHIAPELPPTVGGVADYTSILSRRLVEVSSRVIEPVLVHAGNQPADAIEVGFPVVNLSGKCSAAVLAETVARLANEVEEMAVVLLEYSGYGYASTGAPRWLVNGLHRGCREADLSLITVFHELYASEYRPWKRNFWTFPLQYYVASRLSKLSTGMAANWDGVARWLRRRVNGRSVRMCPSFSNVGEPDCLPSYEEREPYAIHFGGAEKKSQFYWERGPLLGKMLRQAGTERIIDVGPTVSAECQAQVDLPVEAKGILPAEVVSSYLQGASLALLNYPLHCLKKSGVWGSYAAHGVPTLLSARPQEVKGLEEEKHFLLFDGMEKMPDADQIATISSSVHRWYQNSAHSKRTAQYILRVVSECG